MPGHDVGQDGSAQASSLVATINIEVLDPLAVDGGSEGDAACLNAVDKDDFRMSGIEAVKKALSHAHGVVSAEALKIVPEHDCAQLGDPPGIGVGGGSERK